MKGLRIAYCADLGYAKVDPEVAPRSSEAARQVFAEDLGASGRGGGSRLRGLPGRSSPRTGSRAPRTSLRSIAPAQAHADGPGPARHRRAGREAHRRAIISTRSRSAARSACCMNRFHRDLRPAGHADAAARRLRRPARKSAEAARRDKRWTDWSPFSYPFNLTQQPAAIVPCGLTKTGCRSACRSSARATPMRWCCARRAPSSGCGRSACRSF